ncbi:MAG: orotidine-5'-phosphate decarboxylase [Acidithiobacillus sp.]
MGYFFRRTSSLKSPLVVALDYPDADAALALADRLDARQCRVKVGKELFTSAGPAVVEKLQAKGFEIFLDLKFHDIPQTVAKACKAAAGLGVWMLNVHASGGQEMLMAARDAVDSMTLGNSPKPLLIAVTVLTSMDDAGLHEIGVNATVVEQVMRLAALAEGTGMDGVVCSAREAPQLRDLLPRLCLVTPGIRMPQHKRDDQKRIMTPAEALAAGADYLVVGRPITADADPLLALENMVAACGVG